MNVAALFLHNMQATSPGWYIDGDVTDEQRQQIDDLFAQYTAKEQFGGYNTWIVWPFSGGKLHVKRFTWEGYSWLGTPDEIVQKLADYYKPYKYESEDAE